MKGFREESGRSPLVEHADLDILRVLPLQFERSWEVGGAKLG